MALKSYCKPRFRPLITVLACLPLLAQGSGHLQLGALPKLAGKRGAAVQAKIPLLVDHGFHVNSNLPSEEYLIPLKLTWKSTGALDGGAISYPKPTFEKYEFSEKPLSVFTGSVELVANFKVKANAPAGPGAAVGQLRYQACNDKACFPPKTVEVTLPYQVQ